MLDTSPEQVEYDIPPDQDQLYPSLTNGKTPDEQSMYNIYIITVVKHIPATFHFKVDKR